MKTSTHLVLFLLCPAVAVVTLGVGLHGHGGEEVLHGVVAKIITDRAKLQQIPERTKNVIFQTDLTPLGFLQAINNDILLEDILHQEACDHAHRCW